MADQATEHTSVAAPPERCFAVVADIEHYPEWAADIKEVTVHERDGEGRPLAGHLPRRRLRPLHELHPRLRLLPRRPGCSAWRLTRGDITTKLDGSYIFEGADGGGTDITYHLEVELRVPIPGFIKMRAQSRIMATALRDLKARVESSA